jgi:hypothetical protein
MRTPIAARREAMAEKLTVEHFLPHVNKSVRVDGWHHTLTISKIDARKLEEWEKEIVPRQPFIVMFRGPPGDVLPEGMRELHVEGGPSFRLYIIPVLTPQRDRQNYQSVFN